MGNFRTLLGDSRGAIRPISVASILPTFPSGSLLLLPLPIPRAFLRVPQYRGPIRLRSGPTFFSHGAVASPFGILSNDWPDGPPFFPRAPSLARMLLPSSRYLLVLPRETSAFAFCARRPQRRYPAVSKVWLERPPCGRACLPIRPLSRPFRESPSSSRVTSDSSSRCFRLDQSLPGGNTFLPTGRFTLFAAHTNRWASPIRTLEPPLWQKK